MNSPSFTVLDRVFTLGSNFGSYLLRRLRIECRSYIARSNKQTELDQRSFGFCGPIISATVVWRLVAAKWPPSYPTYLSCSF